MYVPIRAVALLDWGWILTGFIAILFAAELSFVDGVLTPLTVLVLLFSLGAPLAAAIAPAQCRMDALRIYVLSFCFNAVAAIVLYQLLNERYGVPYLLGGTDDQLFDTLGRDLWGQGILGLGEGRQVVSGLSKYVGYPMTVAWTYWVADLMGGPHSIAPRYLNVLGGAILAVLVFRLALHLEYSRTVAKLSAYLVGIYPFLAFHNSLVLRDTLAAVFIMGATVGFLEMWQRGRVWPHLAIVIGLLALLTTYRDSSAFLLVVSFGLVYLICPQQGGTRAGRALVVAGMVMLAVLGARTLFELAQYAVRYQAVYLQVSAGTSGANSVAMQLLRLPFPLDIVVRVPLGLIWPLPIPSRDPAEFLRNSGAALWYPLVPFIVLGWASSFRNSHRRPTAIITVVFFLAVALVTLASRHMTQYVPFLLLFGVGAYHELPRTRLPVLMLACVGSACALGLYLFMKMTS